MQPIFRLRPLQNEEVLPLVAFMEDAARKGGEENPAAPLNFFLLGLGGAVLGLVFFDATWKSRFRAVWRPLVRGEELR
jgi:hypothetical protein